MRCLWTELKWRDTLHLKFALCRFYRVGAAVLRLTAHSLCKSIKKMLISDAGFSFIIRFRNLILIVSMIIEFCWSGCSLYLLQFSLPAPKGGKHANNPLLFEDQPMPQQRASKQSKANMNVFDLDYVAGSSPFAVNDVTSRASHFGIHSKHDVSAGAYFNKRNPNEGRKRQGRRKWW